jgi:hypothetical protein
MLLFAIFFSIAAVVVLTVKRPVRPPYGSPEYRRDDRIVASVLLLIAIGFAAIAWIT